MVKWHLDRVVVPSQSNVLPECDTDFVAFDYHLIDLDTGAIAQDTVCTKLDVDKIDDALSILTDAGFTPNDWTP